MCLAAWPHLFGAMAIVKTAPAEFEKPTHHHAIKLILAVQCSVEEAAQAVDDVVAHESVKSVSQMNGAIVICVDSTDKVSELVERGMVIRSPSPPSPLTNPATKAMTSNAPVL